MAKPKAVGATISIEEYQKGVKRKHKFNAVHTWVNGIRFDSKREAERYQELLSLQIHRRAVLRKLQLQRTFEFFTCGIKTERWRLDFCYEIWDHNSRWQKVAEDVTGFMTARKTRLIKLFEAEYGDEWKLRITK